MAVILFLTLAVAFAGADLPPTFGNYSHEVTTQEVISLHIIVWVSFGYSTHIVGI